MNMANHLIDFGPMTETGNKQSWAVGKKTVLCVGNTVIDYISVCKKFPRENEPNKCYASYWQRGGNASNNCTVLRLLGVKVEFFGKLSTSPLFGMLVEDMRKRGIIFDHCPRTEVDPPFSTVILASSIKSRNIINCNKDYPYVTYDDFKKLDLNEYGWIHFQARHPTETIRMMQRVTSFNKKKAKDDPKIVISLDFDKSPTEMWPLVNYCDYVVISRQIATLKKWETPLEACTSVGEWLRMRWGVNLKRPYVIFLWGSEGAAILDKQENYSFAPSYKLKKVVDSLGAGDVFMASLIYALYIRERPLSVAVDFGNRMGSYKVTNFGYDHLPNILVPPTL
ncbi:ketohexokinase [Scaptodrosophila lebanonensis]|uniref:Ketohexokinase n=1 Tax=Drosophila lebanonensis TaxID=7225 RepID=A0A6J2TA95_DROLE|nr:ketohexokinase [Scaptodrosophila lebanonensis]